MLRLTIPKKNCAFPSVAVTSSIPTHSRSSKVGREEARANLDEPINVPRVSDGVVYRVLDQLLILGGERLQYRGLDVEQIGSVYEGLMGFELEDRRRRIVCLKPEHVVVNLEELLRQSGPDRLKTLKANASLDLKDKAANEVKAAKTLDALQAALSRRHFRAPARPHRQGFAVPSAR